MEDVININKETSPFEIEVILVLIAHALNLEFLYLNGGLW